MKFSNIWIAIIAISLISCKSKYRAVEITGTIVEMDSTFDAFSNIKLQNLVQIYKAVLDKEMKEVIGTSAEQMDYKRPESLLTNLTSDVMKKYGDEHLPDGADVSIMNVHGHRAILPEGPVTVGKMYEIYSFDNTVTFLELKGSDLINIFNAYARIGGGGTSANVRLVIHDRKVKSVTIDAKSIEDNKVYNVVTLDYLAEGNDNMSTFQNALSVNDTGVTLRDIMIEWVREKTRRGEVIESALDGRILIL